MTQSQVSILQQQEWPGNIRKLKNVIERAVISTTGCRLRLDLALSNAPAAIRSPTELSKRDPSEFVTIEEFKELEKANLTATGSKRPLATVELIG